MKKIICFVISILCIHSVESRYGVSSSNPSNIAVPLNPSQGFGPYKQSPNQITSSRLITSIYLAIVNGESLGLPGTPQNLIGQQVILFILPGRHSD